MSSMGKWLHRLSEINETERTAICSHCGPTRIRVAKSQRSGNGKWRCSTSDFAERQERLHAYCVERDEKRRPYAKNRGGTCTDCGFVPKHPCQLDTHHIDGNHTNNDPSNLTTLCANCHRLYTFQPELVGVIMSE